MEIDLEARREEEVLPEFDYTSVPEEWRDELEADTQTLHSIEAQAFALAVQRGLILLRWKERLQHGQFMEWRRWALPGPSGQGYSDQSYSNWMNLASHYPELPQSVNFQLGAAYMLASSDVSDAIRQQAIDLANSGIRVNKRVAYVLANAPTWLVNKFVEGKVSAVAAEDLSRSLEKYPPAIGQYAEHWQVSSLAAVDFIAYAISNHNQKKKEDLNAETLFQEILSTDGWLQAGEFSVHINEATQASIEAFLAERRRAQATLAIQKKYFSKRSHATFRQFEGGYLMLDGLDPEFRLPEYLEPGDTVEVEIRVKRVGDEPSTD